LKQLYRTYPLRFVRATTDRLEHLVADHVWPLPKYRKYREMSFPA
jgi:glutamine synthetase type III